MDYHLLDVYTLKSMSRDIGNEIERLEQEIERLKEKKEVMDIIIARRQSKDRNLKTKKTEDISDETVINPLDMDRLKY